MKTINLSTATLAPLLVLAVIGAGCRVPSKAVSAVTPGKQQKDPVDLVQLQQQLLRFHDDFSGRMITASDQLRRGTNELDRIELAKWKLALANNSMGIASSPNAYMNLLDSIVLVSLTRKTIEDHWRPKVFGDSADEMLAICREAEDRIWHLAAPVLKAGEREELSRTVQTWYERNPDPNLVLHARGLGFAARLARLNEAGSPTPTASVFNLLGIDPLSGLDPATREIAQTRLFAERALFVAQRMPTLLRWQTELLAADALAIPTVQQLVTNSTQLTASVERAARVAEQLPAQLTAEREAIIKALEGQEKTLTPLVNEMHQTLTAGEQMSTSLNTTLKTFDALMKRFGVGESNNAAPPSTNSEPFRIQDYGKTATQLEGAARQLTELLATLDRTLGSTNIAQLSVQFSPVVQQAQSGGRQVVDYAFWNAVLVIAILLCAALIYRFLSLRLKATIRPRAPQPSDEAAPTWRD